jgi:hypothetical protein
MIFHFLNPIGSQSILRFSLYKSIDKIHAFLAPSIGRYLIELHLFGEYFLPYLFAIGSEVGSLLKGGGTLPVIN